ncbi:zinc finger protein [Acrodontium crateriforme]|uniref:Zinc finger protein n=1 Tax=Acrodontium crateriforme TaxID=150365 RepID=A0AAQ3LYE3_9PEZI|nr:zinc finger protein [Acrodontium crateriforme]
MATFAEFHQQPMAATHDFTLYPYQDMWNQDQTFLPQSQYPDQSYPTTYDSFHPQQAFSQPPVDQLAFNTETYSQHDATYSPAHSASQSFEYHQHPSLVSSHSDSGHSSISSAMGSPAVQPQMANEWSHQSSMSMLLPGIIEPDNLVHDVFASTGFEVDTIPVTDKGCVDPALIQPSQFVGAQFPDGLVASPQIMPFVQAPSPAPSRTSVRSPRLSNGKAAASSSPYTGTQAWQPYPAYTHVRQQSVASDRSGNSQASLSSEESNKGLCPIPTCGRHVKDLKAHMLTHQNERPEKCPIPTCEYNTKGFARKYDKNRHTLTHYKGTMVCGFCPGSGSAAEKSFNRADVFKRHLTSVHGVEQTPPNARRKSPSAANKLRSYGAVDVSGTCSTCNITFASAQEFYEHLDDCVLRVVQQADPSEAINQKLLASVAADKQVQQTMERHMLPTDADLNGPTSFDQEEDDDSDDEITQLGSGNHVSQAGSVNKPTRKGLTLSKNGVPLAGPMTGKSSKRRKNYPLSWGSAPENMKMRKRVLCVFDGPRRLWKDDMMLDAEHEVRIPLGPNVADGRAWVTDLDVQTLRRAEGVLNATDEEKGPWVEADDEELDRLMQ